MPPVAVEADIAAHRAMNIIIACIALFVALPLLLLIALAIKLTSRGPVLYTQERVGLDRRTPRRRCRQPPAHRRPRRPALHHLQVPHDAGRRRARHRRGVGHPERPPDHPGGPLPAPVPAGRDPPAAQRDAGRDEHRRAPARAPHHLRRAAGAHQPSIPCGSGPSRGSPAWPRSTTTTTARWTTCGPRSATTWSTSAAGACGRTSGSCSRPSRSSSSAVGAGEPPRCPSASESRCCSLAISVRSATPGPPGRGLCLWAQRA